MNRTIGWASAVVAVFLFSAACELGLGLPTPAPEGVELSVLIQPADKGYVELDGSLMSAGVAVPVKRGKLVNLAAISLDEEWRFARWERDLSGINSEEALLMDGSKVIRAVFVPVDPHAAVEPTPTPPDTTVPPTPAPATAPVSAGPAPVPAPTPTPDTTSESPAPAAELEQTSTAAPTDLEVPPPVASFSIDVSSGSAPFAVQFSDTSLGTMTEWQWEFGDGGTSTERSPSHEYIVAGSHTVRLTVSGPGGTHTRVMPDIITVEPGPAVSLEVSPSSVTLGVQEIALFEAVGRDAFGNAVPGAITWAIATEGGSVGNSGLFTAGTLAGTFPDTVTASLQTDTIGLISHASVTVKPGPVFEASVRPAETSLDIGSVQSFEVEMRDRFGNSISDALISWKTTSEAGTIDADGNFTAGIKAGSFPGAVQVEVVTGGERASAAAAVSIGPDPLASIEVQPSFIVIEKGISQQFLAAGFDQHGNEITGLIYRWGATGGDITQDGLYTAGDESGSYQVGVAATFGDITLSGLATVPIPPVWVRAGNSRREGDRRVAALLPDGRVLVGSRGLVELYDPATHSFSVIGEGHCDHFIGAANLLADGRVLLTGGYSPTLDPDTPRCAELYDPATGILSRVGDLNVDRTHHTATLLRDGRVLIAGGFGVLGEGIGPTLTLAEIYDPVTETFSITGSLNIDRRSNSATLLPSGQVLIAGGLKHPDETRENQFGLRSAELYDPANGTFRLIDSSMTTVQRVPRATLLNSGEVLITSGGGAAADLYDPATETFRATGRMTADHFAHTATLLPSGEVLIVGGVSRFDMDQVLATLAVEVYDPATETFKAIDGLNDARNDHTATLLSDGRVLVVGGSQIVTSPTGERIGRGVSSAELFIPSDFSSLPPPSASFSVDVESGVAPLAVKFAHTTQGPLTSVQWDFGDGTTSTEFSPSHTYTRAGSHSVRLAALGPGGASTILVPDLISVEPGPLASVVVEPTEVVMDIGATQRFTAKPIDEFGNKVSDVLVSWSASFEGGVFDADGVLTASTSAGVYERGMSVQVTQGAVTRTGTANVTIEPDPLARIDVEPSPVIVRPGESLNLTPAGLDRYGNVIPDLAFVFATPADTTLFDSDGKVSEAASGSLYAVSVQAEYKGSRQSALVTVAVAPVWMPTGSMAGPRRSHTATRLDDGRVLIVGWFSSQAELYNPATGAFTATGETHDKRLQGSTATRLNDGRVLIAGGRDGKGQPAQPVGAPPLPPLPDLTSAEIYDPAAGTFTPIGNLSTPRAYHTATLLPDGRVLIAGGQSDPPLVGAVEIYDPATGTFEVAGCLDIERRGHSATLVQNGKVLIAGGSTGVAEAPTEFELYDPELGRTVLEGSCGCGDLTAAALLDGKALIVGSIGPAVLYDPSGESFTVTGTMTSARRRPTATLLDDGRVLVAGGFAGEGDYFTFIDSTELYDPGTGTFSVGPSMTTPRLEHTATVLPGGLVLVVGGESGETTWSGGFELSTAEVLYLR